MTKPRDLAQRWRDRAADMENGDGASRLTAYNLRVAADELDSLGMELESHPNSPIPVPDFNNDGSPLMDEGVFPPIHKHHFEWVTRERWVTPWREVGERETSEELSARLEANRT